MCTAILTAVLTGLFVSEISTPAGIAWKTFYKTYAFWPLVGMSWILYWHATHTVEQENDISNFTNEEYCLAYLRSQCLPELAERARKKIREGDTSDYEKAVSEFKETLE
ncbi:hypothetical protein [Thalassospira lucentensis]|uniref:hypothetical protein n=1 Tax=Thalassospira lucentensis TaxID=168935 RepID=UPI000B0E8196|nr:hypothetical protein [Thalassospira lucentensis]